MVGRGDGRKDLGMRRHRKTECYYLLAGVLLLYMAESMCFFRNVRDTYRYAVYRISTVLNLEDIFWPLEILLGNHWRRCGALRGLRLGSLDWTLTGGARLLEDWREDIDI